MLRLPLLPETLAGVSGHHTNIVAAIHRPRARGSFAKSLVDRHGSSLFHQVRVRLLTNLQLTPSHNTTIPFLAHLRESQVLRLSHDIVQIIAGIATELRLVSVAARRRDD